MMGSKTLEPFPHEFDVDECCRLYEEGWTLDELGQHYGCNPATIGRRLKAHGVTLRKRGSGKHTQREGDREWQDVIIPRAAEIVRSYSTPVSVRQLHYRLVSEGIGGYVNGDYDYQNLGPIPVGLRRGGRGGLS